MSTSLIASKSFAGTWKLNPAKSEIPPVTKSQVLTIDTDGVHVTMTEELVNDKGEILIITVEGEFDGQDYPVKGTPFADTVSYRLLDSHTIEGIAKKNGQICVKETAVLSQDGHVVRVTYLSYDERGTARTSHGTFERIDPH